MPSVGEIFNVTGVDVGTGVDVDSGVNVAGTCVGVFSGVKVTVDGGGVAALWQAVSKIMERRGMIFFMYYLVVIAKALLVFARSNPLNDMEIASLQSALLAMTM